MLIALVLIGVHIGIALGVSSVLGVFLITNNLDIALSTLGTTAYESIRSHTLAVIPLFVLMGELISRSGSATDLYKLCDRALHRIPGRLAVATVIGNTAFAAVSGVAIASAATFSRIAYPEMRKMGYKKSYALGVITGSACLGMLIPPSVLLIIWAILTEGSVGALFIGGIVPGVLLGLTFIAYCVIAAILNPSIAPTTDRASDSHSQKETLKSEIVGGLGVIALIIIVLGGLWGGVFTPTEAAGFGVLTSILIGWIKGMRSKEFMDAIYDAGRSTAPIMFLLIAGSLYARLLAMSGGINLVQDMFVGSGLSIFGMILIMTIVWLVLGALIDSISVILITVPIFFPVAMVAGFDEIAFAIYGILIIEAGLLTPPVGLLVFTVKAAVPDPDLTLTEIFKGSIPYWAMMLVVAMLILAVPELASWLPNKIF
ncbi:MAG TPA: C4-dicarboxylate ABC transporter permease [Gammaproteobacteria bacterium]|nr:TRAP transporter large permease [Pseudomonadota bacterium]HAY47253.1 C4-dicarboxylate ABC transporter permease [Gammaproteobacteria bacterium]